MWLRDEGHGSLPPVHLRGEETHVCVRGGGGLLRGPECLQLTVRLNLESFLPKMNP